jgi:uncharacterized damage-inducible protein DinB
MAEQQTNLLTFYKGWDTYQGYLLESIAPLSPDQLALRAAPHLRTIGENVAHIIGARARWFHMLMGQGDEEITPLYAWDASNAPLRTSDELLKGLEKTWQMIQQALARWTPADLDYIYEGTHNGEEYRFSRQWVIWHVIEHDIHHGGEIFLTLGMHHLSTPDL